MLQWRSLPQPLSVVEVKSISGTLRKLNVEAAEPIRYSFQVIGEGDEPQYLSLSNQLGSGVRIEFLARIVCIHCGRQTAKSYGGGYCYPCFTTLARCDLCVVSPARCHYHAGTCREPEWGESFCMHGHLIYLANTSGLKVGITRSSFEEGRWMDQGAVQAMAILWAQTRRDAGLVEVQIAQGLSDRTDWRRLVQGDVPELDLAQECVQLQADLGELPAGVSWIEPRKLRTFTYPIVRYPSRLERLRLAEGHVEGNLLGIKGQYLLLSSGVFNVRQHTGYEVRISLFPEPITTPGGDQLGLFG